MHRCMIFILLAACLAGTARSQDNPDSAWAAIQRLGADTQKVNLLLNEAIRLNSKMQINKQPRLDTLLRLAISLSQQLNYTRGMAIAYDLTGVEKRENSQYLLAIRYHQEALSLDKELKDMGLIAKTLNNMGVAYRRLDENQKAFECHLQALQTAEQIDDQRDITIATNSIGNILLAMGKYENAIEQFDRSLQMETDQHNTNGIALNLANLGLAYEGLGQLDRAIDYFKRSLAYNQQINNQRGMAICYNSLGEAYQKKGNYPLALSYFKNSITENDQISDKIDISQNYLSRGQLFLSIGRFEEGISNLDTSLEIARRIQSKSLAMASMSALGGAYRQKGNYKKALDFMEGSQLYKDSIINETYAVHLAEMQALYELGRKDNQIKLLQQESKIKGMQSRRNWFIALIVLILSVIGVIAGFFYMRHRELQSNRRALQLELGSLRSQMNPHFIFNSLNSIHKYIWSNQTEEASEYLTKFSRLMRIILENTQHPLVVLSKELQSLSLYLELESLRCSNKFSYSIHVDPEIDQDDVLIPPLIIQPFVENAIWHGLVHREGIGELKIEIMLQKKIFICTVSDNGIGRKKAMEIKQRKGGVYQSMGMKVTQERIKLTSELNKNKDTNIEITDMQDSVGKALGTRVTVRLPAEFLF